MNKNYSFLIVLGIILVVIIFSLQAFIFIVQEHQQALVLRLGEPVRTFNVPGANKNEAGLHFKIPFIESVVYFERRVLEWDNEPSYTGRGVGSTEKRKQITTLDKKNINLSVTVRWIIDNPRDFFRRYQRIDKAHNELDSVVESAIQVEVGRRRQEEIIRDSNRIKNEIDLEQDALTQEEVEKFISIDEGQGRSALAKVMLSNARNKLKDVGIELLDLVIIKVDYIGEVKAKAYERMISERLRIAEKIRSDGKAEQEKVLGQISEDLKEIISEAKRDSEVIMGEGDQEAAAIYNRAYSLDRDFYTFTETLKAYEETVNNNSKLIISTDSDFYKFLKSTTGR